MPDIYYDVDIALAEVPINLMPIVDVTGLVIDDGVTYDEAGVDLNWNFTTTLGAFTQTNVVPTDTGGAHDFVNQGNGMFTIEIPASGGTINNDTEGFGWFSGFYTADLPFRGPVIGFRAAAINNSLIDGATVDVNVTAIAADVITPAAVDEDADFIIQALSITNQLDVGNVLVDSTVVVTTDATVSGDLLVTGTTTHTGNASYGGTLDIVGAASANSVSIDVGFDVVGELSANSVLVDVGTVLTGAVTTGAVTAASTSITGQLDAGNVLVDSTAVVTTDATISGDALVTGTTTLTGAVSAPAGITADITGDIATCAAATVAAIDDIDFGATMKASINTEVDSALDTAIPAAPTADSINQYIHQLKWVLTNLMVITEATGNVVGYKDDDVSAAYTVAAAFASAAGVTTRKRLE